MKKNQIIEGFNYNHSERMNEVYSTIKWNSKIFDSILIACLTESDYDGYKELDGYNSTVMVRRFTDHNLSEHSHQDNIRLANDTFDASEIKCYSNIDIIFGTECKDISLEDDVCMVLTDRNSYEIETHNGGPREGADGLKIFNSTGELFPEKFVNYNYECHNRWLVSQSAWLWKTVKPVEGKLITGSNHGEGGFLFNLRSAGYKIVSGALKYPTYHNHLSVVKTNRDKISGYTGQRSEVNPNEVL